MKKILGVLLAGAVALTCFTACNSSTQENSSTTTDGASEAAQKQKQRLFVWRIYTTLVQE